MTHYLQKKMFGLSARRPGKWGKKGEKGSVNVYRGGGRGSVFHSLFAKKNVWAGRTTST